MQSLLESLLNYILRHHHETLLRDLGNYIHYLRHHHELLLRGSWNYVLTWGTTMNSHQEVHRITSIRWGTTMNSDHEIHGITSIRWGTTMNTHNEVHGITSIRWGTTMNSHQEGHGITSYPYHIHVSPNNDRVLMHINFMPIYITNNPNISYQTHQFQPITYIIHTYSHPSCLK